MEGFGEKKRTTTKDDAGKAAVWNESFDINYQTVLENLDGTYSFTAWDCDHPRKDEVICFSSAYGVAQLLATLGADPIEKSFYLYDKVEYRSQGQLTVKIQWLRLLGGKPLPGGFDLPEIDQSTIAGVLSERKQLRLSPKLEALALSTWYSAGAESVDLKTAVQMLSAIAQKVDGKKAVLTPA